MKMKSELNGDGRVVKGRPENIPSQILKEPSLVGVKIKVALNGLKYILKYDEILNFFFW